MNDGKIIIDKIISDAEKVASVTIAQAQKDVDALLKAAKDKAHRQLDQMDRDAQSEAAAVKAKEISAELLNEAKEQLKSGGLDSDFLCELADYILSRKH
mgnify:CR=1 FL=1